MTWPGTKVLFLTAIALMACPETGVAQSAGSPAGSLRVQLLFDGRPLLSKLEADFSCFDHTKGKWINCRIESADGIQSYVMPRPAPGWYRMHVNLNENEDNPDSYPGDYVAIQRFEITPDGSGHPLRRRAKRHPPNRAD